MCLAEYCHVDIGCCGNSKLMCESSKLIYSTIAKFVTAVMEEYFHL